eukprot:1158507-Pelagomonas_calceolata.AAC.13
MHEHTIVPEYCTRPIVLLCRNAHSGYLRASALSKCPVLIKCQGPHIYALSKPANLSEDYPPKGTYKQVWPLQCHALQRAAQNTVKLASSYLKVAAQKLWQRISAGAPQCKQGPQRG